MNHLLYLLLFNLVCSFSKLTKVNDDQSAVKQHLVNTIINQQTQIEETLMELAKDAEYGAGIDFREVKTRYIKDWRQTKLKMRGELGMKVAAMQQGKDPEQFVQERKNAIAAA